MANGAGQKCVKCNTNCILSALSVFYESNEFAMLAGKNLICNHLIMECEIFPFFKRFRFEFSPTAIKSFAVGKLPKICTHPKNAKESEKINCNRMR